MNEGAEQFPANGKIYASEREAIVAMIDRYRVAEAAGGVLFAEWAKTCRTPLLRGGLAMIAERENYHARIFEKRMNDLGAECRATLDDTRGAEIKAYFADPQNSDFAKLTRFNQLIGDPESFFSEIATLASRIGDDIETREMLRLFRQDEISTTTWLREMEAVLSEGSSTAPRTQAA
jgi:hypothetical protein